MDRKWILQATTTVLLAAGAAVALNAGPAAAACPNEALRGGPSAGLPECRAYELVTPPDSNGRLLEPISAYTGGPAYDLFPTELASPASSSFVYETFAGALAAPAGGSGVFDLYRAQRSASGWQTTEHLSHPPTSLEWPLPGGISADHGYSFQDEGNTAIFAETRLRHPNGSEELIGSGSLGSEPRAQGRYISPGGEHVILSTGTSERESAWCDSVCAVLRLEPEAAPTGTGAVYDRAPDGPTHVVSLLPGNKPAGAGENALYQGTSKDGRAVAFTIGGTLYVRLDNAETLEVAAGGPEFGGLSDSGRYLTYVSAGTIHRFDTETKAAVEVNPAGEAEIVNVSADGSHVYFISTAQLDGSKGTAGQPNLYVWSGAGPEYVATVAPSDLVRTSGNLPGALPALTDWTDWVFNPPPGNEAGPGADSSRSTPDGSVIVFESKAQLTPYKNVDNTEIYRYDDASKSLECVSCNPNASEAKADARLQELEAVGAPIIIHNLSDDGSRVFFETPEALVKGDTNGVNDVYEWRQQGEGGAAALISSGHSPADSYAEGGEAHSYVPHPNLLLGVTPSGGDVFFAALEALVPGAGENGTQAIYDARVNGGFPAPSAPEICVEEGCRPATSVAASSFPTLNSETMIGTGNVKPPKPCRRSRPRSKQKRAAKSSKRRKRHRCRRRHHGRHHHKSGRTASPRASAAFMSTGGEASASPAPTPLPAVSPESGPAPEPTTPTASAPTPSGTEGEGFGIEKLTADLAPAGAGLHPDFTTKLEFSHFLQGGNPSSEDASAAAEDISFSLPPGLLGNPSAYPACETGTFASLTNCPTNSQIGVTKVKFGRPLYTPAVEPIYNLAPPHPGSEVARLGFIAGIFPVFIDVRVRTAGDYGVTATVQSAPGLGSVIRATTTIWGDPASSEHDEERLTPIEAAECENPATCKVPAPGRASTVTPATAFMTNPSACQEGEVAAEVTTYQEPGKVFKASAPLPPITECSGLPFAPSFEAEPTSHAPGAPTGLKTVLKLPQHLGPEEAATATMREARVTLPAGMQVAAGAANWIGTCSEAQVGYHEEVDAACPDNSKLGTATILSPALSVPVKGTLYQRAPRAGHQFGLWLVADDLGLHVKLPGELEPDPTTGRLTAVFSGLPQVPVEEIDLNVWGGPRAPLQNPDRCGTYTTDFTFRPHSEDPAVHGQAQMQIDEGCTQPFTPTLQAGVTDPAAGHFSPFVFDLVRDDGQQALRGFDLHLPEGELAKLAGVPLCQDADAVAGSCPLASRIGSLQAVTGPGPEPLLVPQPGKAQPALYLAGPYQGAPYSVVSEVPAQAGPFDLGVVAVRSGLQVDPETARVTVKADPLPQFFEGVGIAYRRLHAVVDRPGFSLNPTDCRETAVSAEAISTWGTIAHPAARFQVDGCRALAFKPKLTLRLRGATRRGAYPALRATVVARPGDADIGRVSVALPHSEFLAQEHINTICTRVRFAAHSCPKGSVYGHAKAWTPLLDQPLEGPVYLRSSSHPLPDMVIALRGPIEIDLVGRIDSHHGGIRSSFEALPDAPLNRFVLQMKGAKKGLLVNSTDICRGNHRATVRMRAQNGRRRALRPKLQSRCAKHKDKQHR